MGDVLIDKLELLLALAKERHFGRAAEACGVTQPTMSTSLKQLEEILGVMLVQRGSRFQGFTPEGERTLDWARRIVGDARAMRQEINSLKEKLSGEIRIAAIPTVLGMVASLTTPFRARHPDVRFRIVSCTSIEVGRSHLRRTSGESLVQSGSTVVRTLFVWQMVFARRAWTLPAFRQWD